VETWVKQCRIYKLSRERERGGERGESDGGRERESE